MSLRIVWDDGQMRISVEKPWKWCGPVPPRAFLNGDFVIVAPLKERLGPRMVHKNLSTKPTDGAWKQVNYAFKQISLIVTLLLQQSDFAQQLKNKQKWLDLDLWNRGQGVFYSWGSRSQGVPPTSCSWCHQKGFNCFVVLSCCRPCRRSIGTRFCKFTGPFITLMKTTRWSENSNLLRVYAGRNHANLNLLIGEPIS